MMRALAVIALFVVVALAGNSIPPDVVNYPTTIQAINFTGLEVVLLDGPSWATHIQRSWGEHEYYVFGDKTLRTIHSGPSINDFYAEPDTDPLVHPLLDLHTFYFVDTTNNNNLNKITVGVSDFLAEDSNRYSNIQGAYLPLYSAILNLNSTATTSTQTLQENGGNNGNPALNGFMMYAVRCDYSLLAQNTLLAYFAGFRVDPTNGGLSFVLLRTSVNLGTGGGLKRQTFSFNASSDVFTLYTNQFTTFNEAFKPWVHVLQSNNGHNIAVVVDPNTKAIYSVDLETGFQSTRTLLEINTNSFTTVYDVVSSSYDYNTEQLVVGLSATGNAGVIRVFNLPAGATTINANYSIPAYTTINLPSANYTNPKALAIDDTDLYIGVNGANVILKYNFANQQFSYQMLPEFMHRTWDAVAAITHVYFVTYEQHSKVFRVNKTDFCPTACPYYGYCVSGQCTCYDGFELSKDKSQCVLIAAEKEIIYKKEIKKVKGGEAALGVFFALAVVAAAAGWFMWWRNRRGAYQAV